MFVDLSGSETSQTTLNLTTVRLLPSFVTNMGCSPPPPTPPTPDFVQCCNLVLLSTFCMYWDKCYCTNISSIPMYVLKTLYNSSICGREGSGRLDITIASLQIERSAHVQQLQQCNLCELHTCNRRTYVYCSKMTVCVCVCVCVCVFL